MNRDGHYQVLFLFSCFHHQSLKKKLLLISRIIVYRLSRDQLSKQVL